MTAGLMVFWRSLSRPAPWPAWLRRGAFSRSQLTLPSRIGCCLGDLLALLRTQGTSARLPDPLSHRLRSLVLAIVGEILALDAQHPCVALALNPFADTDAVAVG